jgi:hypothetical protein
LTFVSQARHMKVSLCLDRSLTQFAKLGDTIAIKRLSKKVKYADFVCIIYKAAPREAFDGASW